MSTPFDGLLFNERQDITLFEAIMQQILCHSRIILHRHKKPDGDAMGSQVGLKHILKENFPEKEVYAVGDSAGFFGFVDDSVMDEIPDSFYDDALAIVLDCGAPGLVSDDRYALAKSTARFDHHLFVEQFCQEEAVDSSFESCCGLVTAFAVEQNLRISPLAAKALYTGMITDSGRFRYDSTSSRTFQFAAHLMAQGIDTGSIFRNLYADSLESKQQKARFIQKIRLTQRNVAYIYTDLQEFQTLGMDTFAVSRGMVNTMADIKGVDIWVNFTETENGVLCELRSATRNINPIAVKYGGGGHAKASGATVADKETAMAMLRDLDNMMRE